MFKKSSIFVGIILVLVLFTKSYLPVFTENNIILTPLNNTTTGITLDTQFRLEINSNEDCNDIKHHLTIEPNIQFEVHKDIPDEYIIKLTNKLEPETVYTFKYNNGDVNRTWVFQTVDELKLNYTIPNDQSSYVPIKTGIELHYNNSTYGNIEDNFSIEPKVNGVFEYHDNTVVFIPEKLEYETTYTVNVKDEFDTTFSFITKDNPFVEKKLIKNKDVYSFSEKNVPVLDFYCKDDINVNVSVYKYNNVNSYINDIKETANPYWNFEPSNKLVNTERKVLDRCLTFDGVISNDYLVFPNELTNGLYLVDIKSAEEECQMYIQITDVVCYFTSDKNKSLIWLNNTKDKKPISNADVIVEGIGKGKTKQDGTLVIEGNNVEQKNFYIKVKENNNLTYVEVIPYMSGIGWGGSDYPSYPSKSNDYWSFIYTDREAYYPNDKINIWGTIKPRKNNAKTDDLSVSLCKVDLDRITLYKQNIKVDEFNTINTSIDVKDLNSGSFYYLIIQQGNEDIVYKSIDITNIKKPSYRINIAADKENIFNWQDIKINVDAKFFEGTPLPNFKYNYRLSSYDIDDVIKGKGECNKDGNASFKLDEFIDNNSWHPVNYYLKVQNDEIADTEVQSNYVDFVVYPRDTMLDVTDKILDNNAKITINTNRIFLDAVKNKMVDSYDEIKGEILNIPVKAQVYEIKWIKEVTGNKYDYVNKEVITTYNYKTKEELVDTYDLNTYNGTTSFDIKLKDDTNYKIIVTCKDSKEKDVVEEHNIRLYDRYSFNRNNRYTLKSDNKESKYDIGETVNYKLYDNGKVVNNVDGRMLYMIIREGIRGYQVLDDEEINFEFKKSYSPNVYLRPIYFDGKRLYKLYDQNILYDYEHKRLNISVNSDRKDYKPGDEVSLDIHVTDKDLNPCQAKVNLSVVDEAFLKLYPQDVTMLKDIYRIIYDKGVMCEFLSDREDNMFGGAEKGSGSDSPVYIRKDFKDTALFKSCTTNNSGDAKLKFKLPDNLTNWRVTYMAMTKDLQGGQGKININSKLPFFISLISDDVYMNGDNANILYRIEGTDIDRNKKINITTTLYKNNKKEDETHSTIYPDNKYNYSGQSVETGDYRIVITARQDKYSDSIEKKFKVVDNRITCHKTETRKLSNQIKINSSNNLTSLTFYNEAYGKHYKALNHLMYQYGNRIDKRLVSYVAGKWINDKYDEDVPTEECNFYDYQRYNGGISLLPYSDSEIELTAKCCLIGAEKFEEFNLIKYFKYRLKNEELTDNETAAIYCGLSFLGEEVLPQIRNVDVKSMTVKEKLYYSIALAKLGDYENAKNLYNQVIKEYNKEMGSYNYLQVEDDEEKCLEYTALGLVASVITNQSEKDGYYEYLVDHTTKENCFEIEKLIYILNTMPDMNKQSSFEYTIGSKKEKVILDSGKRYNLLLNKDQINELKFNNIKGNIEVLVGYDAPITEDKNKTSEVKFSKKIGKDDSNKIKLSEVTLVTLDIDFTEKAPEGLYEITDILPSGFRFIQLKDSEEEYYFQGKDGDKLKFGCLNDKDKPSHITIQYYIRPVAVGTYKADHSVIMHSKSNLKNYTDQKIIEVEPLYDKN